MIPRAGRLRHKITVEYKAPASPSKNSIGEDDYTWATFLSCQAQITSATGRSAREQNAARQIESPVDTQIKLRYFPGITADMRVLHDTTYYDITLVDNVDERGRMTMLYCTKGASRG